MRTLIGRLRRLGLGALTALGALTVALLSHSATAANSFYATRYSAAELAERYGCQSYCHRPESSNDGMLGPPHKAIAAKYKGNEGATLMLMNNVKDGSRNVWGKHEMLPQANIPDVDLKRIIDWIMTQ